ncbi:uncharacterized protein BDV14DRAFT_170115 [Aspergillus stella-maris]|uniref:uncharacterized protein n=1 Tax=Aspergillus stella-maris TaxID=1810926 RepID=UPI003CCCC8C4
MLLRVLSILFAGVLFYLLSTMATESTSVPALEVQVKSPTIPASFTPPIPLSVQVTVANNADAPVTLLHWGSILDPKAGILGVFEIRNADTDEVVTLDSIKFARQLPPPLEDFVQIPAGKTIDTEIKVPLVPLAEGKRYTIQAKGRWQAIWNKVLEEVPGDDLAKLTGAERGDFLSNVVPISFEDTSSDLK